MSVILKRALSKTPTINHYRRIEYSAALPAEDQTYKASHASARSVMEIKDKKTKHALVELCGYAFPVIVVSGNRLAGLESIMTDMSSSQIMSWIICTEKRKGGTDWLRRLALSHLTWHDVVHVAHNRRVSFSVHNPITKTISDFIHPSGSPVAFTVCYRYGCMQVLVGSEKEGREEQEDCGEDHSKESYEKNNEPALSYAESLSLSSRTEMSSITESSFLSDDPLDDEFSFV